jgi:hypothetical protein
MFSTAYKYKELIWKALKYRTEYVDDMFLAIPGNQLK